MGKGRTSFRRPNIPVFQYSTIPIALFLPGSRNFDFFEHYEDNLKIGL